MLLALLFLFIFIASWNPPIVNATQTETITSGIVDETCVSGCAFYRQSVQTATAAGEIDCVDARGYDWVAVTIDIGNTINVDVDRALTDNGTIVLGASDDITADVFYSEAVKSPYYCYDIDACTSCTFTATWYLIKVVQ